MKARLYIYVCLFALLALPSVSRAQDAELADKAADPLTFSLLTCSPHDEVYSLYGHTAIRFRDERRGGDWVFNYGMFSFKKPFFVLRFTFGITDYELAVMPFDYFTREYRRYGSSITEQVLNLTAEEKRNLLAALSENYQPENRVYRYNFFYNNCTTQARDIIEKNVAGAVVYGNSKPDSEPATYRKLIHRYTKANPWCRFGNDLALGLRADLPIDSAKQQFLPEILKDEFAHARIVSSDSVRPLVSQTNVLLEATGRYKSASGFPLTPTQCFTWLLVLLLAVSVAEWWCRALWVWIDAVMMAATGLAGLVVAALMLSTHPTTTLNLQILVLCPLSLLYIRPVIRQRATRYWMMQAALLSLFFIGSFVQDYADGMMLLALCLLLRAVVHALPLQLQRPRCTKDIQH